MCAFACACMKPVWNRSETRYETETCRTTKKSIYTLCALWKLENQVAYSMNTLMSAQSKQEQTKPSTRHSSYIHSTRSHIVAHTSLRQSFKLHDLNYISADRQWLRHYAACTYWINCCWSHLKCQIYQIVEFNCITMIVTFTCWTYLYDEHKPA